MKNLKNTLLPIIIIILGFSCSDETEKIQDVSPLKGSVIMYDIEGDSYTDFEDMVVEITDPLGNTQTIEVTPNGQYSAENVPVGTVVLQFKKKGFGGVNSIEFVNTDSSDTISEVVLVEKLPITFSIENFTYNNRTKFLTYSFRINEEVNKNYLVGAVLLLYKESGSKTANEGIAWTNGYTRIDHTVDHSLSASTNLPENAFNERKFLEGDTVYATCHSISVGFGDSFRKEFNGNYKIKSYNLGATSEEVSFVR